MALSDKKLVMQSLAWGDLILRTLCGITSLSLGSCGLLWLFPVGAGRKLDEQDEQQKVESSIEQEGSSSRTTLRPGRVEIPKRQQRDEAAAKAFMSIQKYTLKWQGLV